MAKIVTPRLLLDGADFLPKSSYRVSISQAMGGHSSFTVSFPTSSTEGYGGALMDNALMSVGRRMSIGLDDGALEFTGIVTAADLHKSNGAPGDLVLSGFGASILMSRSVQCLSYGEGTPLGQVLADTFAGHSTELLKTKINAGTDIRLPYTVQYNEDDFGFVRRLCARYGVWFYDDGKALNIGLGKGALLNGTYGADVQAFRLSAHLQGRSFGVSAHDWVNDLALEANGSAFAPGGGHSYTGTLDGASSSVFAKKGNYHWPMDQHEYSGQQGVDRAAKVAATAGTAAMVRASGTSELTAMCVGDVLEVEGLDFAKGRDRSPYGTYLITRVDHRFDHSGHYSNSFEGVPEGTGHPPYGNIFAAPFSPAQRGLVLDNADPAGLGRIKVQFPWQRPMGTSTPWIKMQTPYSGAGKGLYFVPENGEEILVGFEGGNAERPYMLSAGYNTSASSGFADAGNNIKAIRTRSGHLIELNDTDGAEMITIKDKNENLFSIDTASNNITIFSNNDIDINSENNISVTAKETMSFKAKNIKIGAEENINLSSGKDFTNSAGENHNTMSKNQNTIVEENSTLDAKVQETIADEITLDSKQKNLTLASGKTVDIQSKEKVKLF